MKVRWTYRCRSPQSSQRFRRTRTWSSAEPPADSPPLSYAGAVAPLGAGRNRPAAVLHCSANYPVKIMPTNTIITLCLLRYSSLVVKAISNYFCSGQSCNQYIMTDDSTVSSTFSGVGGGGIVSMGRDVHSLMLLRHFLCRPQGRPSSKKPWRMVLERLSRPCQFRVFFTVPASYKNL